MLVEPTATGGTVIVDGFEKSCPPPLPLPLMIKVIWIVVELLFESVIVTIAVWVPLAKAAILPGVGTILSVDDPDAKLPSVPVLAVVPGP